MKFIKDEQIDKVDTHLITNWLVHPLQQEDEPYRASIVALRQWLREQCRDRLTIKFVETVTSSPTTGQLAAFLKDSPEAILEKAMGGQGVPINLVLEDMNSNSKNIDKEFTCIRGVMFKIVPEAKRSKTETESSEA